MQYSKCYYSMKEEKVSLFPVNINYIVSEGLCIYMYIHIMDQLKRTITASGDLATPTKSHVVSYAYHNYACSLTKTSF